MRNSTFLPPSSCWSSANDALAAGSSDWLATSLPSIHSVKVTGSDPAGTDAAAVSANHVLAVHREAVRRMRGVRQAEPGPVVLRRHRRRLHDLARAGVLPDQRRLERLGAEDCRPRDAFGGEQVALHQHRRDRQHVADVVEAIAGVVLGEVVGRAEIHAKEIANGVVVLRAIQPPDGDAARIGHGGAIDPIDLEVDPRRHGGHRFGIGPRILLRRHLAGANLRERLLPGIRIAGHRVDGLERLEVQAAALAPLAMAGNAGVFEKRLDGGFESRGVRGIGRRLPRRRRAEERQGEKREVDDQPRQRANPSNERRSAELCPIRRGLSTYVNHRDTENTETHGERLWQRPDGPLRLGTSHRCQVQSPCVLCVLRVSVVDVRDQRLAVAASAAGTSRATRPPSKVT